jgi:hypothetical protein
VLQAWSSWLGVVPPAPCCYVLRLRRCATPSQLGAPCFIHMAAAQQPSGDPHTGSRRGITSKLSWCVSGVWWVTPASQGGTRGWTQQSNRSCGGGTWREEGPKAEGKRTGSRNQPGGQAARPRPASQQSAAGSFQCVCWAAQHAAAFVGWSTYCVSPGVASCGRGPRTALVFGHSSAPAGAATGCASM